RLTDKFLNKANQLINEFNLNIQFILDGAGTLDGKNDCLINLWRPLVMTYTFPNAPLKAFTSNTIENGYDRLAINNMQSPKLDMCKLLHYGKFSLNQSIYPYLYWEPSDQRTILSSIISYLNGLRHSLGLRFAINIDPVQFTIYSAQATNDAWNIFIDHTQHAQKPLIIVLNYDNNTNLLAIQYYDERLKLNMYTTYTFKYILDNKIVIMNKPTQLPLSNNFNTIESIITFKHINIQFDINNYLQHYLFIVTENNQFIIYNITTIENWFNLTPLITKQFPLSNINHSQFSITSTWSSSNEQQQLIMILHTYNDVHND
ncbi:unnamed protein product, partial [Didymodactylos carnosus]